MKLTLPQVPVVVTVAAFAMMTAPLEVLARAGGGGGVGGGKFRLIAFLVLLPVVALYVAIRSYLVNRRSRQCRALLHRLQQVDAAWDAREISRRVSEVYLKVQQAWAQRDQTIARGCLSDWLYAKHTADANLMRAEHRRNVLERIHLVQAEVVDLHHDRDQRSDWLLVYIEASMIDYMVNDLTGERISGDASRPEHSAELWRFVRGETGWAVDDIRDARILRLMERPAFSEDRARADASATTPS